MGCDQDWLGHDLGTISFLYQQVHQMTCAPQIAAGASPVVTYTETVQFAPATVGRYPTATNTAIAAIEAFEPGNSLALSWELADGTRNDEVLVEVSDQQGNRFEI